jgi:hypothetical protein
VRGGDSRARSIDPIPDYAAGEWFGRAVRQQVGPRRPALRHGALHRVRHSRYPRRDLAFATTAVSGVAGPRVWSVEARVSGRWAALPLSCHPAFVLAVKEIAGPAQVPVRVRYADGRSWVFAR